MGLKKVIEFFVKTDKAKKDIEGLNKSLDQNEKLSTSATQSTKDMDKSYRGASKGSKVLAGGIRGIGLAIKATGIGLLVAGIVKLTQALMKNQVIMDAVQDVTNSISFVFQTLVNTIVDMVQSVREGSDQFSALQKVGKSLMTILLFPMRMQFNLLKLSILSLALAFQKAGNIIGLVSDEAVENTKAMVKETKDGIVELAVEVGQAAIDLKDNAVDAFNEVKDAVKEISEEMKEAVKSSMALAKSINDLETLIAVEGAKEAGRIALLRNQAEELKRIRDDESLTFKERIEASEQYGKHLDEINALNLKQAQRELDLARLQAKQDGNNEEAIVKVIEAENKLLEVQLGIEKEQTRLFRREQRLRNSQMSTLEELRGMSEEVADEEIAEAEEVYNKKLELINKAIDDELERNRLIEEATIAHNLALDEIEQNKQDSIKDIIDSVNKEAEEETFEDKLAREQEEALLELEALGATEEQKLNLINEFEEKLANERKRRAKEDEEREKQLTHTKIMLGLTALGALSNAMDEQSELSKGIALAETAYSTYRGIMAAMDDSTTPSFYMRLANSAIVGAMGIANAKKILSTSPGKGPKGGTRGASSPVQPSFNVVGDARQQAMDEVNAEQEDRPIKTYVVAGEVSTAQELDRNRVQNSRFL